MAKNIFLPPLLPFLLFLHGTKQKIFTAKKYIYKWSLHHCIWRSGCLPCFWFVFTPFLYFLLVVWTLKKKLCEGAYILKVIIATLYKGAKNKLTNKDSINIHQRIDAGGVEWTDSIFGGTYVLPQIVLTLVLTFWWLFVYPAMFILHLFTSNPQPPGPAVEKKTEVRREKEFDDEYWQTI